MKEIKEHTLVSLDSACSGVSSIPWFEKSNFAPHPGACGAPTASSSTKTVSTLSFPDLASGTCNTLYFKLGSMLHSELALCAL